MLRDLNLGAPVYQSTAVAAASGQICSMFFRLPKRDRYAILKRNQYFLPLISSAICTL